jgi:D-arginine dehydrogenase
MDSYDVIIVGGGIAGASAGYEVAANAKVLLIERESQFGFHSTGRSAAIFLQTHGPEVIRALASASKDFLLHPPDEFTESSLLKPRGMLFIGRHDQVAELDRTATECARFVSTVRRLDSYETLAMVPVLREDNLAGSVFDPEAMDLDVHAIHYGFLRGMRARGGDTLIDAELMDLQYADGSWTVTTRVGKFTAPVIVNAAGAWGDRVAAMAQARPVGLVPKRRTAFVFDPPVGAAIDRWPVVHDVSETFYFKPDAGKILASPADETPIEPCDVYPDDLDIALAVDRIQNASQIRVQHIIRKWAGLRSFVRDGCPVVGFDPECDGFFWLAGQGGYGIETSPAMGRLCATLLGGNGVPSDLAKLGITQTAVSPSRFLQP